MEDRTVDAVMWVSLDSETTHVHHEHRRQRKYRPRVDLPVRRDRDPHAAGAGQCPEDQVLSQPRQIRDPPDVGIERETLSVVDISGWRKVENLMLRTRR
jgi:hypothetical protein